MRKHIAKGFQVLVGAFRFGPIKGLLLLGQVTHLVLALKFNWSGLMRVTVPGYKHPLFLRLGTSDIKAFIQVVLLEDYGLTLGFTPHTILDGGGNIGLTAAYYANRYPDAKIVSVEPQSGNFTTLKRNTENYMQIIPIQGGLWDKSTHLLIRHNDLGEWNFSVEETDRSTSDTVTAYSIIQLIERYTNAGFDLIKLDIEGSEKEVLAAPDTGEWLACTKGLIIELHDRMMKKSGCSASFIKAIAKHDFIIEPHGESLLCLRV
jgi:FkbM family methyltransferase